MDHNPTDLDSLKAAREEAERLRAIQEAQDRDNWKWLMSRKRGRQVVWCLLEEAGVFRSVFAPEPTVMARNEGERNGGLRLLDRIHRYCPELYSPMMKENTDDRSAEHRDSRHERTGRGDSTGRGADERGS